MLGLGSRSDDETLSCHCVWNMGRRISCPAIMSRELGHCNAVFAAEYKRFREDKTHIYAIQQHLFSIALSRGSGQLLTRELPAFC